MILKQKFKTGDGARKRVDFENAMSKTHNYYSIRFRDNIQCPKPLEPGFNEQLATLSSDFKAGRLHWQIEKKPKLKVKP